MALAPKFFLNGVPSNLSKRASNLFCCVASKPKTAGAITSLTFLTAFKTPLPKYLDLSPSLNSRASDSPVEAPDGTMAEARVPSSKRTSGRVHM